MFLNDALNLRLIAGLEAPIWESAPPFHGGREATYEGIEGPHMSVCALGALRFVQPSVTLRGDHYGKQEAGDRP